MTKWLNYSRNIIPRTFRISFLVKWSSRKGWLTSSSFVLCSYAVTFSICVELNTFRRSRFYQSCQIVNVVFLKKMPYFRNNYEIRNTERNIKKERKPKPNRDLCSIFNNMARVIKEKNNGKINQRHWRG